MSLSTSLPRSSATTSPATSGQHQGPITIETLISYLVAAKRSLSCIHLVHRATTVLAEARSAIESTAALVARTTYLRRSLQSQLKILRGIQFELEGSANATQGEFQVSIKELDAAGKRLEQTIERLKQTAIEDGFQPPPPSDNKAPPLLKNTLFDFVEETPVEKLRDAMKEVIDNVQDNQDDTNKSIQALENDLQHINELLTEKDPGLSSPSSSYRLPDLPLLLKQLEEYAHSMALSLESLVKHFDLCATAIKHTEGAGDAVIRKYRAGNLPADVDVSSLNTHPTEPMNADERAEMLAVLSNDAAEVEEVVLEIQEHAAEMEGNLLEILHWRERNQRAHSDVLSAFRHIETLGTSKLTALLASNHTQAARWVDHKSRIDDGLAGMEELCETYDNFLHAYDRLIIEAARRRSVKKQMERVMEEAQSRLDELYEKDLKERQLFREELGDYLPSDIWEGLHLGPARYEVRRVDVIREGAEGWLSVPELRRDVVEGALRRLRAGGES